MTLEIGIYDHSTGENVVREMNADEVAEYESRVAQDLADKAAKELDIKAKADARAAAEVKLAALGLTPADLRALDL